MAFDVYVGTLTRYYRREWENVAQKLSREQGYTYRRIVAGGESDEPLPAAEDIQAAVGGWCRAMSAGIEPHGFGRIMWDEGEEQPYFTDRPSWNGYSGLLLLAAHSEHPELPTPKYLPEVWSEDAAYERAVQRDSKTRYRTILMPSLWLPTEFPFVFEGPTLASEENSCIGSVFTLKEQLDDLNDRSLELRARLKAAATAAPAAAATGFLGKMFGKKNPPPEEERDTFAEAAEVGLQVFRQLATQACEHRLPILLDY